MNRLIERCAMLDVHKSQITACVRVPDGDGGRRQDIREFRTTTAGLLTLADWLRSWAVTVVGMESTGVYWRRALPKDLPVVCTDTHACDLKILRADHRDRLRFSTALSPLAVLHHLVLVGTRLDL